MLKLAAISKAFGMRRALVDVSLEVSTGEVVLLVGRNGAGKTTLLRIATGYLDPDSGAVTIDGIAMATARTAAQSRLGYLPEHAPAPLELTVRDHLMLRAWLKQAAMSRRGVRERSTSALPGPSSPVPRQGLPRVVEDFQGSSGTSEGRRECYAPRRSRGYRTAAMVDEAMATAGVAGEAGRLIGALSKGFRQRVGLADALLGAPPLLLLDEPTSGMDPVQVRAMRDRLAIAAQRQAVLVSSHAVADLESVATRVAVVKDGKLIEVAPPDVLRAKTNAATLEDAVIALCGETAGA